MACHMIAHRFAMAPRVDFQTNGLGLGRAGLAQSQPNVAHVERSGCWFGFWERHDDAPDFVVTESLSTTDLEDAVDPLQNSV